jgi:hypothetical protein
MSKKRDIAGLWWLPTNPDERWVGTLTLECDEEPKLIVSSPKNALQDLGKELIAPPAIVGHDQSGKLISLLFPSWPRTSGGMALSQIEFAAHYAILGLELSHHNDFKVNELTFQMQHLLDWVGLTGFLKGEASADENFIIRYKSPEKEEFVITSNLSIKFQLGYIFNNGRHEKKLEEEMRVTFVCKEGIKLSQCKDLMGTFRQLLHFATLEKIYPLEMTARKEGHGFAHEDKFYPQDIELWNSIIKEDVKSDFRPIFRYADVKSRFVDFFSNWLKFTNDFEEALNSYSTTIYHSLPSPITHICLTQALEAYHGVKFASHGQTNFCGKIQELAEKYKDHLKGLVDDVPEFAKAVRDNRHYYTHHNPEDLKAGRVVSGTPLCRLNEKLKLIFQMCVLTEMGIPVGRFVLLRRQLATYSMDFV